MVDDLTTLSGSVPGLADGSSPCSPRQKAERTRSTSPELLPTFKRIQHRGRRGADLNQNNMEDESSAPASAAALDPPDDRGADRLDGRCDGRSRSG